MPATADGVTIVGLAAAAVKVVAKVIVKVIESAADDDGVDVTVAKGGEATGDVAVAAVAGGSAIVGATAVVDDDVVVEVAPDAAENDGSQSVVARQ